MTFKDIRLVAERRISKLWDDIGQHDNKRVIVKISELQSGLDTAMWIAVWQKTVCTALYSATILTGRVWLQVWTRAREICKQTRAVCWYCGLSTLRRWDFCQPEFSKHPIHAFSQFYTYFGTTASIGIYPALFQLHLYLLILTNYQELPRTMK